MMNDFEEYIRQGEPEKKEKSYAWQTAIGVQVAKEQENTTSKCNR